MSAATSIPLEDVQQEMTCPTCGARQVPSDACRRCQSDLRIVRSVHGQWEHARRECLALLASRRLKRATEAARRVHALSPDEASLRLLATCYILQGNFSAALNVYMQAVADDHAGAGGEHLPPE